MKKGNKKKNILSAFLVGIIIICIVFLLGILTDRWGFAGTSFYIVKEGECFSAISTYHGDDNEPSINENKECSKSGYYIDDNKVSINIGSMNCANSINIVSITTDLNMNVYIKAKERKSPLTTQCLCNPSLNIYFTRKVKSVTLVPENGIELGEC